MIKSASFPPIGPRRPRRPAAGWLAASTVIACLAVAPLVAVLVVAGGSSDGLWPHLLAYVLPEAARETVILLLGVGFLVTVLGTGLAWLVTAYDFPGRRFMEWALLLPLAMPTYIVAYAYLDLLHPIGPVQSGLRAVLGLSSPRDLNFPDIRSMPGCILLLGFVLYPYVYGTARAAFLLQARGVIEAAHSLGAGRLATFVRIAMPLARPAIAAGASLALLEALNDIGASEFLGVRTLTVSIYATWINRSSLPGAAQIALFMLAFVLILMLLERGLRRNRRYADAEPGRLVPKRLHGMGGVFATVVCALPVVIGFAAPALHLANEARKRLQFAGLSPSLVEAIGNTAMLAAVATLVTLLLGLCLAATVRLVGGRLATVLARTASLGYAVPGTVLAIGLMMPLASLDNAVDAFMRATFGFSTGLLLSGTGAALVYAYVVRFLPLAAGGLEAGYAKLPKTLDDAAVTLGASSGGLVARIHLPLLWPALLAAAALVFVDCVKELSATLLLRPLDFETLATQLYGEAARGTYEDGAIAALLIVAVGFLPVMLLAKLGRAGFHGERRRSSVDVAPAVPTLPESSGFPAAREGVL